MVKSSRRALRILACRPSTSGYLESVSSYRGFGGDDSLDSTSMVFAEEARRRHLLFCAVVKTTRILAAPDATCCARVFCWVCRVQLMLVTTSNWKFPDADHSLFEILSSS